MALVQLSRTRQVTRKQLSQDIIPKLHPQSHRQVSIINSAFENDIGTPIRLDLYACHKSYDMRKKAFSRLDNKRVCLKASNEDDKCAIGSQRAITYSVKTTNDIGIIWLLYSCILKVTFPNRIRQNRATV